MQEERLRRRLTRLVLKRPFVGSLALRMPLVLDNTQPTAYTDTKVIGFNEHFIAGLTDPECDMLLMHEVFHVVLKHAFRREGRDHTNWNVAGDHVINLMLVEDGMTMPECGLFDKKYAGWTTDRVYADVNKIDNQPEGDQPEGDQPGDGGQPSSTSEYGPGDVPSYEEAMRDGTFGEVRDCPVNEEGLADLEQEMEWEAAIVIASAQEKSRGTMPGYWQSMIDQRNQTHIDWTEALANFLSDAGNNITSTWARANRRFIGGGDYFPSIKREGIEHLVIAVDTSGSVSDPELKQFLSEAMEIAGLFNPKVTFLPCDTRLGDVQTFEAGEYPDEITGWSTKGRGGTYFEPPFDYVENVMEDVPTAMIYFTDGEANFPPEPDYPVLWGISHMGDTPAPWGTSIEVVL
jgi:predicted metal-dependent peptidase